MIYLYTSSTCTSCRKLELWFRLHKMPYLERRIKNAKSERLRISKDEIKHIFSLTEDGADDVISRRAHAFRLIADRYDTMTITELIDFVYENPTCLRRPIAIKHHLMMVGYHTDEVTMFLATRQRKLLPLQAYNPFL